MRGHSSQKRMHMHRTFLNPRAESHLSTSYSKAAEAARSSWASHLSSTGGGPHSPHQAARDQDYLCQSLKHRAAMPQACRANAAGDVTAQSPSHAHGLPQAASSEQPGRRGR
eukprot:CAMPEP_0204008960 /NCGR_PEP_ID=MMETSP0360-20130528/21517_1 /ASSEMBLY_ACC=CAM_ASM_000342 /TAXON_ID=268821 /ORGANISM="Scrippsiella Hangoei, Strain SHTV-5" /LENGTH=111 /DNA_ID=CAMNT_0050951299 /DNA_START=71 /DNA_END=403 /DNA_ORIENTATION=-